MPGLLKAVNQNGPFFRLLTFRLDEEASDFGFYDLKFRSLNHDIASEIAGLMKVQSIPTIIVYDYLGRVVTRNAYADMTKYQEKTV